MTVRARAPSGRGPLGNTPMSPTVVALVVVNVVVFLASRSNPAQVYLRFAMIPARVHQGQWYRLVTAAFLHANPEHILFNMIILLVIGSPVEALVGRVRFGAIYLIAGIGGSVCSYLLSAADIEGIGASGAIFGLFGAYAVLARRRRFDTRLVLILIVIELVISFADPGIDWRAHIGGLIVGAAVTWGFSAVRAWRPVRRRTGELLVGAVVVGVLAMAVTLPPGHVNLSSFAVSELMASISTS
ncbi:MAG: rhomboid family intramembrane serine protease [Actinomycetota bacterium]|nr:rhomboid family intramembrane serine protease [Actinomycetota bacterium]